MSKIVDVLKPPPPPPPDLPPCDQVMKGESGWRGYSRDDDGGYSKTCGVKASYRIDGQNLCTNHAKTKALEILVDMEKRLPDRVKKQLDKWTTDQSIRLHGGEMSEQEVRTVKAVVNSIMAGLESD